MKRYLVYTFLGLSLLLVGSYFLGAPIGSVVSEVHTFRTIGPDFDSVDILLNLSLSESSEITVSFDRVNESDYFEVWPLVVYQFPTQLVIETSARFINQTHTRFNFGWVNASYLRSFITGFLVRIFYEGETAATVNLTIETFRNPIVIMGSGLILVATFPFWTVVIKSRRQTNISTKSLNVHENQD